MGQWRPLGAIVFFCPSLVQDPYTMRMRVMMPGVLWQGRHAHAIFGSVRIDAHGSLRSVRTLRSCSTLI
jgi:hypothetical protein